MKKRYVLKKEIKEKLQDILFVGAIVGVLVLFVGVLVLCFYGLNALDRHEINLNFTKKCWQ